jgi:hypothetical protein
MNKVWRFIIKPWQQLVSPGGLSEEAIREAKEEGTRQAHLLIAIMAAAYLIRHDVLDVAEIDRNAIVDAADHIEKHAHELANRIFGADIDEWNTRLEEKQNREIGEYE